MYCKNAGLRQDKTKLESPDDKDFITFSLPHLANRMTPSLEEFTSRRSIGNPSKSTHRFWFAFDIFALNVRGDRALRHKPRPHA